jgi:hypothetical protein
MQITTTDVELTIDGFPCRTYVAAPKPTQSGTKYPGIVLWADHRMKASRLSAFGGSR